MYYLGNLFSDVFSDIVYSLSQPCLTVTVRYKLMSPSAGYPSAGSAPILPVVIVHYNTPELLGRCLQALQVAPMALLPIVVDTSSEVARATARQQVDALPAGHFITCNNHSLAHAVNVGLQHALSVSDHPLLACMNADVFVRPDAWQPLLDALKPAHVGMVGPVCHDGQGRLQHQGLLYHQHYIALHLGRRLGRHHDVNVPWLSGCFQVVKRQVVLELGGMNSSLRFYNEDIEWCWRLRRAGWTCHLVDTGRGNTASGDTGSGDTGSGDMASSDTGSGDTGHIHPHQHDHLHSSEFHPHLLNHDALNHDALNQDTSNQDTSNQDTLNQDIRQQKYPVVHLGGSATPEQAAFVVEGYRGGYRLSQMYRPPLYQTLHRLVLRWLIWQQQKRNPAAPFEALRLGLARGNLFESPFGDNLTDVNPHFESTHDESTHDDP
jgi:hypothetical protein